MEKTLFQKIIDREEPGTFLYEDDTYVILDNKYPKTPIHYLIVPKKPIPSIADAEESDRDILGGMLLLAAAFAKKQNIKDYKLSFNCGKYIHIPHLHLHFIAGELHN